VMESFPQSPGGNAAATTTSLWHGTALQLDDETGEPMPDVRLNPLPDDF
jgi:hypothetical protein